MAREKMKWVAFRTNAIIPAQVSGGDQDRKVGVGEPVQVPEGYAAHVVHDRFADECAAPKKAAAKKAAPKKADAETALAEAQKRVDDLTLRMESMAELDEGWTDLAGELAEARAALADLQPAT